MGNFPFKIESSLLTGLSDNVKLHIKTRIISELLATNPLLGIMPTDSKRPAVEGPRGKLVKASLHDLAQGAELKLSEAERSQNLNHLAVCFARPQRNTVNIELHHGWSLSRLTAY